MYAGLTIADKDALLKLKECGAIETKIYRVVDIPNVNEALAQIAEMEKKPLTWNERINQMTVEEKARFSLDTLPLIIERIKDAAERHLEIDYISTIRPSGYKWENKRKKAMREVIEQFLASPYTDSPAEVEK